MEVFSISPEWAYEVRIELRPLLYAGKRDWRNMMSVFATKAAMRMMIGGLGLVAGLTLANAQNAPPPTR
jgi:hypothetical protein